MENGKGWSGLVTKRASVMTPLLIINGLLLFFGTIIYLKSDSALLFIFWVPVLIITLIMFIWFAKNSPWMLSSERVALKGMELFGDKKRKFTASKIVSAKTVTNPASKQIRSSEKDKGSK